MDLTPLAGMVFTLILMMMIGGFILLFPLSRRLGALLESRIQEKKQVVSPDPDLARLTEVVHSLQNQVQSLIERQDFVEHLLQAGKPPTLPGGGAKKETREDDIEMR
jgi:hypothetical protein